ncbi:MAG: M20/M25/M40 family metallo-hydrolase [Marinisporobacter sp.]|jgi:succinyl-diaminopimelate desuccinylase|nr:M20/M25/M40 family metallo-hydrolase [Marinisporobacter sp.]
MKEHIEKYINEERIVNLLVDLIEIHSPYFHEDKIIDYVHEWLLKNDLSPKIHKYHEKEITNFKGQNVIGRLKGNKEGIKILLNAHLDTVNICKGWQGDPLKAEIDGDKLYGLGALDMKSGVAALMIAIDAFYRLNPKFSGEIVYTFVSDEEGPYGLGTEALLQEDWCNNIDLALIPEPSSGFTKEKFPCLCLGARGGWNYTVSFKGKAAHAANPEEGISAIVDASKVMVELKKMQMKEDEKLGRGSLCIIEANGGGQACSVADHASFTVFRHVVRGEDKTYIEREVQNAIERANIHSDVEISFRKGPYEGNGGFDPYIVEEDHPYTITLDKCIEKVTCKPVKIAYFSSIGDFNTIATRLDIPTFLFGADGENYHTHDEFVYIHSVVETSKVIYEFLKELLV